MNDNSRIFGISLRGWISLLVVITVCIMSLCVVKIEEPLYTLVGMIVAFYFGQANGKSNPPTPPAPTTP